MMPSDVPQLPMSCPAVYISLVGNSAWAIFWAVSHQARVGVLSFITDSQQTIEGWLR